MTANRQALAGLAWIGLLLAVSLAVIAALLQSGQSGLAPFVVPPPEQSAETFIKDLAAHDFGPAHSHLAGVLRSSVTADALRAAVEHVEQTAGGIVAVSGESSQQGGGQAEAIVGITLGRRQTLTVTVPLVRESGVWRVAAVDWLNHLPGE